MYNHLRSTTPTTIQLPGPRAERGRRRRKIQTAHKADPKRRRKRRIGKKGKESVFNKIAALCEMGFWKGHPVISLIGNKLNLEDQQAID